MKEVTIIDKDDLSIESVWSSPSVYALFLELCQIHVQIRNNLDRPVQIKKIECIFQYDDDIVPFIPSMTPYLTIDARHRSNPQRLEFIANLALRADTNSYCIVVYYRDNVEKKIEFNPHKFIILMPPGPNEKLFFISHKDKEDTNIGKRLACFLRKIGFRGYLSEDDRKPGMDLWKEKIPLAIQSSIAMIILWTNEAAKNPDNIYREIEIARLHAKPLIMVREEGVEVPPDFSKDIEYFPVPYPVSPSELMNLAYAIEKTDRCGGYSK